LQTANLDGETNLKIRKALEKTWDYVLPEKASEFKGFVPLIFWLRKLSFLLNSTLVCPVLCALEFFIFNLDKRLTGEVQCEQPNNSLYTFTGNLIMDKQTIPLSPNQLLLRVRFVFQSFSFFYD